MGRTRKTVLFSKTMNGLTNIWSHDLNGLNLTQITPGPGPDFSPMRDPGGKGIYFVNGKSSGFLTAYHVHCKESTDITSENVTTPTISPDGKRVMYITLLRPGRSKLWVSNLDGTNKVKLATGQSLRTGTWAPDNLHVSFADSAPKRPELSKDDWLAALGIFLLVFLSTFPVVVPFLFFKDAKLALRASNGVAIAMLFTCGYAFGGYAGRRRWLTGLLMVLLGGGLVGIAMVLGG